VPDDAQRSAFSIEGEIVEIIESGGASSLRVGLHHMIALNLPPALVHDLHLGDRIAIDGEMRVDRLQALPESAARPAAGRPAHRARASAVNTDEEAS
jgi:hypothetical protein